MKNTYKHLSCEERDKIAILRAQGKSYNNISTAIGRDKSTISREINRNRTPIYNVYLPHKAHERARERKQKSGIRNRLKNPIIMTYVVKKLKLGWSPEQISGRLPFEHPKQNISHEAIYQYIYNKENRKFCDLTIYLARANKKRKRRGHSSKHQKSHIPYRVSIGERPSYIEKRIQPGHWEADTVISRQSKKALAVILERSSRMLHIAKLSSKSSGKLKTTVKSCLSRHPKHMKRTITYDNGSENVEHQKINSALGTRSYFCNPYHSWEKGSVENSVGLIRRFLPKKTDFATIGPRHIKQIESLLNNRPRKCLGYKTPAEVFNSSVALAP